MSANTDANVVKAAYLRNAFNQAYWPEAAFKGQNSPFLIGIAHKAPEIEHSLNMAFGKLGYRIQGRKVGIQVFKTPDDLAKTGRNPCHALFLPPAATAKSKDWTKAAEGKPILMISDDPGFARKAGDISLVPNPDSPGRFIYHVNTKRLNAKGIRLNSGFLRLRTAVKDISR